MYAIIYKNGEDDYEVYQPDLPQKVVDEIQEILDKYVNDGCSVRGTLKEVCDELCM